ncbi:MAG: condensation domain-containing protein [Pseudomonadota bacterium]
MNEHIVRELSPSEMMWWILDARCRVNFVMHARIRGVWADRDLRAGLDAIQARHPLLRARIEPCGRNRLRFVFHDVAPLPLRVVNNSGPSWVEEGEEELRLCFDADRGPLARAVLLKRGPADSILLFTFHHAVGDALSGAFLIRDLVAAAGAAAAGRDASLPALPLKSEMNAYFPDWAQGLSGHWGYAKLSARVLWSLARDGRPTIPRFDGRAPDGRWRARIAAHELDNEFTARLHEKARKNDTTLHGAFLAAQMLALAADRGEARPRNYFVGSPVNLRNRLAPPVHDDVGFFVTMGFSAARVGPNDDFWPLARRVRRSLWDCVERGDPFLYPIQHRHLSACTWLLGLGPRGRNVYRRLSRPANLGGLAFSNIGRVEIEAGTGPATAESLGFAASGAGVSPFMVFAATLNETTAWNFVGMEPLISREHTQSIADRALKILTAAV